ncbi:hypothetical protein AA958_19470 [Streptomyces sp. CNQ-509]|nr:hypothetical protein AA958_19470 [Streptomyces sp. CNQ-509]
MVPTPSVQPEPTTTHPGAGPKREPTTLRDEPAHTRGDHRRGRGGGQQAHRARPHRPHLRSHDRTGHRPAPPRDLRPRTPRRGRTGPPRGPPRCSGSAEPRRHPEQRGHHPLRTVHGHTLRGPPSTAVGPRSGRRILGGRGSVR